MLQPEEADECAFRQCALYNNASTHFDDDFLADAFLRLRAHEIIFFFFFILIFGGRKLADQTCHSFDLNVRIFGTNYTKIRLKNWSKTSIQIVHF